MNDFVCEHLERNNYKYSRIINQKVKPMKITNKEFEEYILRADILTEEHNRMSLGKIYMVALEEMFPDIYNEIKDTELNTQVFRENIGMFFKYMMS